MTQVDTIVALSSGNLPSGVAVVRISGDRCTDIISLMLDRAPEPRRAEYLSISDPAEKVPIDKGIVVWFPSPNSFTGEDCLEFQVHGGPAVVSKLLRSLGNITECRLAEAGEFSRRAFENGRLDLTELEGLSDLVAAQTEIQRKQAVIQSGGALREVYESWRTELTNVRAIIESGLDFSDQDDVPNDVMDACKVKITSLAATIRGHLDDSRVGEIIRDGFNVVLLGKPNAGKSSLLNALAKRDVAIVTDIAGTTRDTLHVDLDIGGYAVRITDTAGMRDTNDPIEREGVVRARKAAQEADLVIWLQDMNDLDKSGSKAPDGAVTIFSKDDNGVIDNRSSISSKSGHGIRSFIEMVECRLKELGGSMDGGLISRERHRISIEACLMDMNRSLCNFEDREEIIAESLRSASDNLGRITGRVDVEDLLDVIFSEFCIGK